MTSKYRQIVETAIENMKEDAHSDRKLFLEALDVYSKFLENVKPYLNNDEIITDTAKGTNTQVDTEHGKLTISVSLESDAPQVGVYYPDFTAIELYIKAIYDIEDQTIKMEDPITQEENVTGINAKFLYKILCSRAVQEVFIHEYTHFVDDKVNYPMRKQASDNQKKDYYNKPYEINAHYMSWLLNIVGSTFKKYGKVMKDLTAEERLDFLKNVWKQDEDFMNYYNKLNPDTKKRFMSRLYNYFSTNFWKE